ncbi:MAG TPA: N-formylglutamate amidohydrolase [Gammaproteobacteria bacterium]|nr:N-formylglutamate amidohydrolase [Gammaproteobacteria bacterium]
MTRRTPTPAQLLLTCEHGGNRIPRAYAHVFRGAEAVLASHRGWDPGTLQLAKLLARRLRRPLYATTWSRLLVEHNRSPSNPRIWSTYTARLPRAERQQILERWWRPHRERVARAVADAAERGRVVHIAVHSFTPELGGEVRNADVSVLYDSRRKQESRFCERWMGLLRDLDPDLRIRYNYPYVGRADGLTTWLRRRYPASRYLGIELEINQARVAGPGWKRLQERIAASLGEAIA